jgi:hypothetical protein
MAKRYQDKNESRRAYNAQYYADNREALVASGIARVRAWRKANPERYRRGARDRHLTKTYGITLDQFDAMLAQQGNRCKACGVDTPNHKQGWHLDHCHATGAIRGILCHHCNAALGHAQDNIDRLKALIAYVTDHPPTGAPP